MALLTLQPIVGSGTEPEYDPADPLGDSLPFDASAVLHVKNLRVSPLILTIDSRTVCDQGFDHNLVITILGGEERFIGQFLAIYVQNDLTVRITYNDATNVEVAGLLL